MKQYMVIKSTVHALLALCVCAFTMNAMGSLAVEDDGGYRLGPGDELKITVFNHPDLSSEMTVGGDGMISILLIGDIKASNLTPFELEKAIVAALKPDYLRNPSVSVEVLNHRPFYILGEVRAPGAYNFVSGMKVINAVVLAGGYTYRAKKSKVYIDRGGDESERVSASPETFVLPGDIIRVPERFF